MPSSRVLRIPADGAGVRLDRYLASLPDAPSRNRLHRWIAEGRVLLNGATSRPSTPLREGDRVEVHAPEEPPGPALEPSPMALDVRYEDADLVVVNKPAGLVVHPGAGTPAGTLVAGLLHRGTPLSPIGAPFRPGVVHRLDKGTSGLLVVAKTERAHRVLAEALAARRIRRVYRAVAWGVFREEAGDFEGAIGRKPSDRTRMTVLARGGRPSRTHFLVARRFRFATELALRLDTGRTHQIRVHLAHAGHPVFGDPDYGGRVRALGRLAPRERAAARLLLRALLRPALHASELSFPHPVSGEPVLVRAEPPPDFEKLLEALATLDAQ